jgi:hypothetical protein
VNDARELLAFELQAAVGACTRDERLRAPARGTRIAAEIDFHGTALALDQRAPVTAHDLCDALQLGLLDQEVRLGPSTFAGARRAADDGGDTRGEATVAQILHLRHRARNGRHER